MHRTKVPHGVLTGMVIVFVRGQGARNGGPPTSWYFASGNDIKRRTLARISLRLYAYFDTICMYNVLGAFQGFKWVSCAYEGEFQGVGKVVS